MQMELRTAGPAALAIRRIKRVGLAAQRLARWWREPSFAAPMRTTPTGNLVYRARIPMARAGAHARLEAGKRHNLRLAASAFHGVIVTPEAPLSFWRTLGPTTTARGFDWGMEIAAGCAVPAIGGGVCLLSNALFAAAATLGWTILERHGHSMALSEGGALDATIAFPHIDLRIAPRSDRAVLDVQVRGDVLVLSIISNDIAPRVQLETAWRDDGELRHTTITRTIFVGDRRIESAVIVDDAQRLIGPLRTCLDCGETACHARVEIPMARSNSSA